MGSVRSPGDVLRRLAGIAGCLAVAAVPACAGTVPGASGAVPDATATVVASGAPAAVTSAVASHAKRTSPHAPRTVVPRKAASRVRAARSGGTLPAAGNPAGEATVPPAGQAVATSQPDHVIGNGTPASCTSAAVVAAVAAGGVITFSCGPDPVTITMTATATVANTSHQVVLDGGGKVTLSGGGTTQILSMDAGWEQQWPQLVVQNLTFTGAYSDTEQTKGSSVYGGGAIFDEGGQLKVTDDTFQRDSCSNGGALSGLFADFDVINSLLTDNKAIGWGANPAAAGTAGGGSGGAIYTDGAQYNLSVAGTVMRGNTAREGGGAIFFVVNSGGGTLQIASSTLHDNPSGEFQNAPGIFDSVNGHEAEPVVVSSSIG